MNEGVMDMFFFLFDGIISGQFDILFNGQWLYCVGIVFFFDNVMGQFDMVNIIDLMFMLDFSLNVVFFLFNSCFLYFVENIFFGWVLVQYDLELEEVVNSCLIIVNLLENCLIG